MNGAFRLGQRYSIDWNRVDADGFMSHGDPSKNESWVFYGTPVLAVPAQRSWWPRTTWKIRYRTRRTRSGSRTPMATTSSSTWVTAAMPSTPTSSRTALRWRWETGCAGQGDQPARQHRVPDRAPPALPRVGQHLGARRHGLPYVFDRFDMQGKVPPLEEAIDIIDTGEPLPIEPVTTGPHTDEYPLGGDVVDFPPATDCGD